MSIATHRNTSKREDTSVYWWCSWWQCTSETDDPETGILLVNVGVVVILAQKSILDSGYQCSLSLANGD